MTLRFNPQPNAPPRSASGKKADVPTPSSYIATCSGEVRSRNSNVRQTLVRQTLADEFLAPSDKTTIRSGIAASTFCRATSYELSKDEDLVSILQMSCFSAVTHGIAQLRRAAKGQRLCRSLNDATEQTCSWWFKA